MKQHITVEQFQELTKKGQEKARSVRPRQIGSRVFVTLSRDEMELKPYNGRYYGVVTNVKEDQYEIIYDLKGTTGAAKSLKDAPDYPLFSFGELVQICKESGQPEVSMASFHVDSLWETVKEILEDSH